MIEIYCDLKNRTKIYNLPDWCKRQIKSKFPKVKLIYSIKKINKNVLIYFGDLVTKEKIELMPNLKWIHFSSAGTNRAQLKIVKEKKIIVTNSPDGFVHSLASLGLAHIFTFIRGLHFANNLKNKKRLNRKEIDKYFNFIDDLRNKNILLAGFGKVGKLIAKVLKIMNANIYAMIRKDKKNKYKNIKFFYSNEILKNIHKMDFVVNLLPLNNESFKFFNIDLFKKMKKNSYFISLSRGQTVVEKDLIQALQKEWILGAGKDVFEKEPLSKKSKLFKLKNVVLSPHIGNINHSYWEYEINLFLNNLKKFLNKKKLKNTIKTAF